MRALPIQLKSRRVPRARLLLLGLATALIPVSSSPGQASRPPLSFTSVELLTARDLQRRDDLRGELVSLHQDVLVPVPLASGCVRIDTRSLRLDRIYRIRHRPENLAIELTNIGRPRGAQRFEARLNRKGSVRTLYGLMPDFVSGASRRLLLSASTPITGERMTIQFRP